MAELGRLLLIIGLAVAFCGLVILVADKHLTAQGVHEVPTWAVTVAGGTVSIPPALTEPDSAAFRDSGRWEHLDLAGVVLWHESPQPKANVLAELASRATSSQWFLAAAELLESGNVRDVHRLDQARRAIVGLLNPQGSGATTTQRVR